MNNTKLNVYKKVLQELCEKYSRAAACIKERIEELCSENKLLVKEVAYLFMNDYGTFKTETSSFKKKIYKHHFECSVITLIHFYNNSII